MPRALVVKVTCGAEEPSAATRRSPSSAAAVASGAEVSLWLTGEAAWFGVPGRAEAFSLPEAAPLADLLAAVIGGGRVTVCTQCAGPPRDHRGRPASPACGSPAPRPSPRRSSPTAPRRSSTDPRVGPTAATVHPTVPHWLHARQPRLPDPRDHARADDGPGDEAPFAHPTDTFDVEPPYEPDDAALAAVQKYDDRFLDRELSWLQLNQRVLELAEDETPAAAGAGALPGHLRQQPRRVLHGPGGRPQAPDRRRRRRPRGLRPAAARGARPASGRPPAS